MTDVKFWMDSLGWLGALCFLISYFLLITKKWKSNSMRYHFANLLGAILLVVNTYYDASFPSVFINGAWGIIALLGMKMDWQNAKHESSKK
ncbi:hypothetical protein MM239_13035 [Belliella sp. DSM 111904]|uniref:CBU-0592-like domain-containing protein n=1 Tax=Belliella filtrata TaxID=2923435 RepID=A0ABS9V295_9BACT|nr:hypothetical protein [Belliella filtrata]MCH7410325.1 hypothetical protein [Belliella filtrata]